MKTKNYGISNEKKEVFTLGNCLCLCDDSDSAPTSIPLVKFLLREALENYKINRENGVANDSPVWPFPYDGKFSWEKCPGEYFKVRYTEGPKDKVWMKKKDRNYVMRLLREGKLDIEEPNLKTELPGLYEEAKIEEPRIVTEIKVDEHRILDMTEQRVETTLKSTKDDIEEFISDFKLQQESFQKMMQQQLEQQKTEFQSLLNQLKLQVEQLTARQQLLEQKLIEQPQQNSQPLDNQPNNLTADSTMQFNPPSFFKPN